MAFARAIIHSPEVMLLDEPSTGLDIISIREVQNFILRCKEQHKTILLATHNAHEMEMLCDRFVIMKEGKILAKGSKKQLMKTSGCSNVADMFFYFQENTKNA